MALIRCPECGREISDKAVSCPGCGSTHIRPYQGIEWIATYPKIFGLTFIHRSENEKKLECLYCRYVWNAYKIK